MSVTVNTDGEIFINFKSDPVFELIKKTDGDSPNRQRSWTYDAWLDNHYIGGTCGEASLEGAVEHASESIAEIARALTEMSDYLRSYETRTHARAGGGGMSEKETIERLIGIIERLLDENERLRSRPIVAPSMPVTYPTITTTYKSPVTYPSPIVTCETEMDA